MIPDRVRQLLAEAERADGTPPVSDQTLLAAEQGRREVFGSADAVGFLGEGELDLVVRPSARGRGLGGRLLAEMLAAQDRAAQDHTAQDHTAQDREGSGPELRAWAHGENPAAETLLRRAGFTPVRSLFRLALDPARLSAAIAGARPLPEGFAARAFDPASDAQAEAWVRVNAAAFASHPEQGAVTLQDFRALQNEPWFDPADLILAFDTTGTAVPAASPSNIALPEQYGGTISLGDGDIARAGESASQRLAGYTWIKTVREEDETETELYVLGVDPACAGRGLGAALLGETLRRMAAHEPRRITLYVDGDNANARALYDRAGFTVDQRSTQWLRAPQR